MSDRPAFPPRDAHGRIAIFSDALAAATAMLVLSAIAVVGIDAISALLGSEFGNSSGWLMVLLPGWLCMEDFRAWQGVPGRAGIAAICGIVAVVLGLGAASITNYLPPLASGGIGAAVTVLLYVTTWFFGVRWLAQRTGDGS